MRTIKEVSVSNRLGKIEASPIRKLVPFANAAKKRGIKIYHLNIGDPDIKTPPVMMSVLRNWKENPIRYSQSQGEPIFLEALKKYYHSIGYGFVDIPHIQVTSGGSEAISMTFFAIAEPGDEVIVFEPFYANYNSYATVNGVKIVPIPTSSENGFHLPDKKVITRKITKKTKAILICNPSNPTGTVYTRNEMKMLVELSKEYGLFLLSDEVYREYVYDGRAHVSLFEFMKEIPDRAIVLDSLSKRYSLCGARVGNMVSLNKDVMDGVLRIAQGRLSVGLIDQNVAAALTKVSKSYIQSVVSEYDRRRHILYEGLSNIKGVVIPKPEGAFYTIVGLPVDDSERFCLFLLKDFSYQKETVMIAPANGFYATQGKGKKEARIAYVLNTIALKKAVVILGKALVAYNKKFGHTE